MGTVIAHINHVLADPKELKSIVKGNQAAEGIDSLPGKLSEMLEKVTSGSQVFEPALNVLEQLAPEKVAAVREAESERLRKIEVDKIVGQKIEDARKEQEDFDKEIETFKVIKENLEHTGLESASIFHPNSETRRKLAFLMLNRSHHQGSGYCRECACTSGKEVP